MRVVVLTPFWRRPHISRVYWAGIRRLQELAGAHRCSLQVQAVITPGDEANLLLAHGATAHVTMAPNEPRVGKWNAGCEAARALDPDYLLIMGSDDLLSDGLFLAMLAEMRKGTPHYGITDLYMWDANLGRAGHWPGYREGPRIGGSIGLGRFYHRDILDGVQWRLWPESSEQTGMDGLCDQRLREFGYELPAKSCSAWGGIALDIKSNGNNIWDYEKMNRTKVDPLLVRCVFPELALLGPP